ncbi:MAG TPA: DNA polymerase domain-containing protein [Anaerolineaceae bacterium]|nr:DNA polymerase domain-containing protein [Anaerolineaceae bacterium]
MKSHLHAWLLDLYEDTVDGLRLWFIAEDGARLCLHQKLEVVFYASGVNEQLRALWKALRRYPEVVSLQREARRDAFIPEPIPVLKAVIDSPLNETRIFREIQQGFPHLVYYDTDIPVTIRHAARYGTFPMAFCEIENDENGEILSLRVLNSRWDLAPVHPVFRVLTIEPDCDPGRGKPATLRVQFGRRKQTIALNSPEFLLHKLNQLLEEVDPDFVLSHWGDTWLIPMLLELSRQAGVPLRFNRDMSREVAWKKEMTYFSYGQIVYRAEEAHLFGRCHIDQRSAMMWRDYGLDGVLESARVTTLPIENAARVSPGSGISAMQMLTALEHGILVPWHKQQVEQFKDGVDLIQRDRGGLIYQPIVGLHANVAQVDFISMYPAIIIKGNISPEVPLPDGIIPASTELGVVPLTLKPLYEKRVALKLRGAGLAKESRLSKRDSARASALKWLLVVCFGFLGYKNARFGRIEAHEAVTNGGREVLLRAKEVAESLGFEVLHLYVDALWLKKDGASKKADFQAVLDEISAQTGLGVSLDGIYRWVAFLPSRMDERVPVANRYFGVFQDGSMKVRGIEARRRDTPAWVAETQTRMLERLSRAGSVRDLTVYVREAFDIFRSALVDLNCGRVSLEKLVVTSRVSHELEDYRSPTPAARAALQLFEQTGKRARPGQKMRFIFTCGEPDVRPWELPGKIDPAAVDRVKYTELLARAAASIFHPFGIDDAQLKQWAHTRSIALDLNLSRDVNHVWKIYNHAPGGRFAGAAGIGRAAR